MKSSAPWSVKGIERDARETAKEAARRKGMTVGEWLCEVIYAAGDPESSDGEIEGIKTSDIVTAIEHLNKRAIAAETKSATAIEDLSSNLGSMLERLQRIERGSRPDGAPDLEERIAKLEARGGDRQRIEALKSLELAVGQVALQFDAAQKNTLGRLESTERQLQELASRIDSVGAPGTDGETEGAALTSLNATLSSLSERIERAERIASEAAEIRAEAGESVDAEFVERTGARLRVLGDEIKRSGDQIRSLEGLIKKLSDQIDAAERRSSEGVQKVSETISELKSQFDPAEAQEAGAARQEIEAAMAEVTERTEARIAELQRSFEQMLSRIGENGGKSAALEMAPMPEASTSVDAGQAEETTEIKADSPPVIEDGFEAFEGEEIEEEDGDAIFDAEESSEDEDDEESEDAFSFDAEDAADSQEPGVNPLNLLRETENAEPQEDAPSDETDRAADGIDALLADLDDLSPAQPAVQEEEPSQEEQSSREDASAEMSGESAPDWLRTPQETDVDENAVGQEPTREPKTRRNLTPKQRAILAAKIRRKRLAEQGLSLAESPQSPKTDDAEPAIGSDAQEEDAEKSAGSSLLAKASSALSGLRARLPGAGDDRKDIDESDEDAPSPLLAGSARIQRSARETLARAGGVKPVTIALGAAVLLASTALVFVVKDLGSSDSAQPAAAPQPAASDETSAQAPAAASGPEARVPEAPAAPVTQPRTLYLSAIQKLGEARNDAETRTALQELQQAAALGHPPAQLQLGELYKLGQGVAQDPAQARIWYQRAGDGGNLLAMHRAGVMAARGQGGPTNQAAAITWFEKAANLGLVDSQYNLGAIYFPSADSAGDGVQDAAKAYYWYSLAAKNGDDQARSIADSLASRLSPAERRRVDGQVAAWSAGTPDAEANEVAPAQ